jgi:hypothetical protein
VVEEHDQWESVAVVELVVVDDVELGLDVVVAVELFELERGVVAVVVAVVVVAKGSYEQEKVQMKAEMLGRKLVSVVAVVVAAAAVAAIVQTFVVAVVAMVVVVVVAMTRSAAAAAAATRVLPQAMSSRLMVAVVLGTRLLVVERTYWCLFVETVVVEIAVVAAVDMALQPLGAVDAVVERVQGALDAHMRCSLVAFPLCRDTRSLSVFVYTLNQHTIIPQK